MSRHLAVLIAAISLVAVGCGSSSSSSSSDSSASTPAATATSTPSPAATSTPDLANGCEQAKQPAPKDVGDIAKPHTRLSAHTTYVAAVVTNCGDFQITLDSKRAPITGGNFKYLADKHFFDDTTFHRIVPDFVIQGGDPSGDGTGGPGYTVVEAPPKNLTYSKGVVAMAKTSTDPVGASGSQFFVVTGDQGETLTPDYALLGKVSEGMATVNRIAGIQADPNSGKPAFPVVIKSIRVVAKKK